MAYEFENVSKNPKQGLKRKRNDRGDEQEHEQEKELEQIRDTLKYKLGINDEKTRNNNSPYRLRHP
jgi:hypothetical protein